MASCGMKCAVVVLAALAVLAAADCDVANLSLSNGHKIDTTASTVADGGSVTVTCSSGYTTVSSGKSSAVYQCSGTTWIAQTNEIKKVLCVAACSDSSAFNVYGDCSTYSPTTGYNYAWCTEDFDSATSAFAYQVCSVCGLCTSTAAFTPTPTPTAARTTLSSAIPGFAGCSCYSDSNLVCETDGACEVDTSSCASSAYSTHAYSPSVSWDFCAKVDENPCQDLSNSWQDSDGHTCRDYGVNGWCDRTNKVSTDTVGKSSKTGSDTFADYTFQSSDASKACCVCGGGTQKCFESSTYTDALPKWQYDFSGCDETRVGDSCTAGCRETGGTSSSVTCARAASTTPWANTAYVDTTNKPSCSATHQSWGLDTSNTKCSGTPAATVVGSWRDCVAAATLDCNVAISWDYTTNTCYRYSYFECMNNTDATDFFKFKFVGPTPAFAPTPQSFSQTYLTNTRLGSNSTGVRGSSSSTWAYTKWTFSWTDDNCEDPIATGVVWYYYVTWGKEGETTVAGGRSSSTSQKSVTLYHFDDVAAASAYGWSNDFDGTSKYWLKVFAFTDDSSGSFHEGPAAQCSTLVDSSRFQETDLTFQCA